MNCPNCGKEINDTATFCPFCGQNMGNVETKQSEKPTTNPSSDKSGGGFKITASLVLAGISLLFLLIVPGLGIVTSIAGIICGIVGRKKPDKKKWAKIGMIASICLLVFCFFRLVLGSSGSQTEKINKSNNSETVGSNQEYAEQESSDNETAASSAKTEDNEVASDKTDPNTDDFTIMVYIIGSNLESGGDRGIDYGGAATADIIEMANAQYGENVNVLIETGGAKAWRNDIVSPDKIQRFELVNGDLIVKDEQQSASMCNADTLSDYITWGTKNYPASRYGLVLWDHGGGVLDGYGSDEFYPNDHLYIPYIASAIKKAGTHFDFVGFDACLMGCFESGYALKDCADYLVASEESEAGIGWYYTDWLSYIGKNANAPMTEIGRYVVDGLVDKNEADQYWGKDSNKTATLSLIDLSKMDDVYLAWREYLKMSMDGLNKGAFANQSKARANARCYGDHPEKNCYYEMVDMLDYINQNAIPGTFDIEQKIRDSIVYSNSNISGSNGLSVYVPYYYPRALEKHTIPMLKDIGFDDEYFDYFDCFCTALSNGNHSIDYESSSDSADAVETVEVTIPELMGFENIDGRSGIHFSPEQVDTIAYIETEVGIISSIAENDTRVLTNGTGMSFVMLTEDGNIIADSDSISWIGYCSDSEEGKLNVDTNIYTYTADYGTYDDGTKYSIKYAPATLNGKDRIGIVIYVHFKDNEEYDSEILGYVIENESAYEDSVVYEFKKGDVVQARPTGYFLEEDYKTPITLDENNSSLKIVIGDSGLEAYCMYGNGEMSMFKGMKRYGYRYIITDIYQNRHYTNWIYY